MRFSSARTPPTRPAIVASQGLACCSKLPAASTSRSTASTWLATRCATSRPRRPRAPSRCSCLPAKAKRPRRTADCRPARQCLPTSRHSPRTSLHDPHHMTLVRSSLFVLALILITPPYALIALATLPLPRMARYRVISGWSCCVIYLSKLILGNGRGGEGRGPPPAAPRRHPRQAPVGLGNDGIPAHLPAAGACAQARAPLDPVLRLGTRPDESDRHR